MSSTDTMADHIKKADHNQEVADYLSKNTDYGDWRLTCTFYSVIHLIDAYAHKMRRERELIPSNIEEQGKWYTLRAQFVRKHLKQYYHLYDQLYVRSRRCRYEPNYYDNNLSKNIAYLTNLFGEAEKFKTIL